MYTLLFCSSFLEKQHYYYYYSRFFIETYTAVTRTTNADRDYTCIWSYTYRQRLFTGSVVKVPIYPRWLRSQVVLGCGPWRGRPFTTRYGYHSLEFFKTVTSVGTLLCIQKWKNIKKTNTLNDKFQVSETTKQRTEETDKNLVEWDK